MDGFGEIGVADSRVGKLRDRLPKLAGIDVDVSAGVFLFLLVVADRGSSEVEREIRKETTKFTRLFRIKPRGGAITSGRHGYRRGGGAHRGR